MTVQAQGPGFLSVAQPHCWQVDFVSRGIPPTQLCLKYCRYCEILRVDFPPQTQMGHLSRHRSHSPAARQRVATKRWLAKPGVREGQNAKARARMARTKHQSGHVEPKPSIRLRAPLANSPAVDSPYFRSVTPEANDNSILTMQDSDLLSCSCDSPTLQSLEIMVNLWKKDWESEVKWNESYGELLSHARHKGGYWTAIFFEECSIHASEGRALLESIREVVHTSCPYCRERLKYDTILLYDLLICVISEIKFFEVKVENN
ncbi:hypothetical protein F4604DRAFT_2029320 [Suillus subluteus]|nr:hypothetical protein F4604DRAFT_2029320 [Suillus subluteus]